MIITWTSTLRKLNICILYIVYYILNDQSKNYFHLFRRKWAATWENVPSYMCAQRSLWLDCANQRLRCPPEETLYPRLSNMYLVKILIRLRECAGWSDSSLGFSGRGVTSYIWHSADVRAESAPLSALPGIWLAPFFRQKVYDWPNFSWLVYERPHFFWHPGICTFFSLTDFWGCLLSWYSINWLHYLS